MESRSESPPPSPATAWEIWTRAIDELERGKLSGRAYAAASEQLRALRGASRSPERSRIDLYLELLEEAWDARAPLPPAQRRTSILLIEAHRALAAGFADGDRDYRRRRARLALRTIERLAARASDDYERLVIVRLADPLLRLLSALERPAPREVLQ